MKKTLLKIFALALVSAAVMSLASCSAIQGILDSFGTADAHEHSYGEWENLDADNHKKTCECGDIQTAAHAWTETGRVDATHTAEGSVSYACECGATKTETLDKTPDHTYGEWENLDADNHKKTCECGDIQTAAHAWTETGRVDATHTAGHVPFEYFERITPYTDLFLYDVKISDAEKHKEYVGVGNELILSNLERLFDLGCRVIVRTPVIVGVNDSEEEIKTIKKIAERAEKVELLPYHAMGEHKYAALGKDAQHFEAPQKEKMEILSKL